MRKILIPIDFSDNGQDALNYAIDFVSTMEDEVLLHLLNVVVPAMESIEYPSVATIANQEILKNSKKILANLVSDYEEKLDDKDHISLESKVTIGPVGPTIISESQLLGADLIIMGTSGAGRTALQQFLGSVSANVVEDSKIPVLAIPPGYVFKPIDNLVYASDLDQADNFYIWKLSKIIKPHVAIIQCLHITEKASKINPDKLSEFKAYIEEGNPTLQTTFHNIVSENIEEAIAEFAENHDAEMIAMHKSARTFWTRLFGPRHSKRMTYHLNIPLLVLKKEK